MSIQGKDKDIKWVMFDEVSSQLKSKFAPVAPYHIYQQFVVNGFVPKNILLLAHDVVEHKKEYQETFAHEAFNNTHIIMDNSLVETGGAVDASLVFEAAEIVAADVVVLPDVMGKGVESATSTIEAFSKWKWQFRDYKLMAVIHGRNIRDWFDCAELLKNNIDPDWISIPRKAQQIVGYNRIDLVKMAGWLFPNKPVHLLGFSDEIEQDIIAAAHPSVRSIDSAVPLRVDADWLLSTDAGPRGKWWEEVSFANGMIDSCKKVDEYINAHIKQY